ncbi:MAG: hypothetical protein AAF926_04145, partial [Pseudomonadota bacterium]
MSETLIEDWPFPMFRLEDRRVVYANLAAQEWTGDSLKKMCGTLICDIIQTDPGLPEQLEKSESLDAPLTTRGCTATLPSGASLTCHTTVYPVEGG